MRQVINHSPKIDCTVSLPLSKSIINRLLIIHHISGGELLDGFISDSSDTLAMQKLLQRIHASSVDQTDYTEINVGNAGTVMRFLTALLAITPGHWIITGIERMQQRPIKPLTDALLALGANLSFVKQQGYPPLRIKGNSGLQGGKVKLDAGVSSQFISALMMLGPVLKGGLEITLGGDIISGSYIRMTQALMQKAGADIHFVGNKVSIKESGYKLFRFSDLVEPDWSAAAFWYQVAAFSPSARVFLPGLNNKSVQGDSVLPLIFHELGVESTFTPQGVTLLATGKPVARAFNYDFTDCPDLAQAVIVTCAALGIKGRFSGLKTLRVKETDRIDALKNELIKLGYAVQVIDNEIVLSSEAPAVNYVGSGFVHCYDDHRMAMAFAPLALLRDDISIDEPEVVKKSYPGYWHDLALAGFEYSEK